MALFRIFARVAVLLLVASLATATGALPVPRAQAVVAADVDTDGDGLSDAADGCPTVASSNPTGCPTASRKASLKWLSSKRRLQATITSPVTSCSSHARIKLWRVRSRRSFKLLAVDATSRGRYRFKVRPRAKYFVTVSSSYSSGVAECRGAISRKVRVPGT